MKQTQPQTAETKSLEQKDYNAQVKSTKQTITDSETGIVVKHLYFLKITRGNITTTINVGEKTYETINTLTEDKTNGKPK